MEPCSPFYPLGGSAPFTTIERKSRPPHFLLCREWMNLSALFKSGDGGGGRSCQEILVWLWGIGSVLQRLREQQLLWGLRGRQLGLSKSAGAALFPMSSSVVYTLAGVVGSGGQDPPSLPFSIARKTVKNGKIMHLASFLIKSPFQRTFAYQRRMGGVDCWWGMVGNSVPPAWLSPHPSIPLWTLATRLRCAG